MKALFKTLLYAFSTLFLFTHCTNKEKRGKSFVFTSDTVYINKYWDIDNLVFEQSTIADFEIFSAARPIQFNKTDPYSPPPLFMYDDKMTNPITKQKKYTNVYSSGFRFWNASIENDEGCGFHFGLTWAGDPDIDIEHNATFCGVDFNYKYDKLKFYNGITFQSTKKEVINAFGQPDKETHNGILYYTFDNDIKVTFTFFRNNDTLSSVGIYSIKQDPQWIFKEPGTNDDKKSEQPFSFMKDTIFINQNWDIDNLKFGQSTDADFDIKKKKRKIRFKESHSGGHADGEFSAYYCSLIKFESYSLILFESGLKFLFSKSWEEDTEVPEEYVLYEAYFSKYKKFKFYNGITIKSTKEDVIKAFGEPQQEWSENDITLYYTFDNGIFVYFSFENNYLSDFNIHQVRADISK